MAILDMLA